MIDFPNLPNVSSVGRTGDRRAYTPEKKETANPAAKQADSTDVVQISAGALYKGKLNAFSAVLAKEMEAAGAERIAQLKEAYAGDRCPVSAFDLAGAILIRIKPERPGDE